MTSMSGGEIIAKMLSIEGVTHVFGIIDGTYFGLYANLKKYGIRLITPRHESSAAHMAGAYAKLTGKLGVCIASNGPGVANILPGVVVENAEGNRVLLITSSRRQGIGYPDRGGTFQYFDQVGTIRNISKWSESAQFFGRIPELLRQAFRKCYQDRPGLVHLDVPENLMNSKEKFDGFFEPKNYRRVDPIEPTDALVFKAAELLAKSQAPLIHAGYGVIHAGAFAELEALAELLHAAVTTSWAGRSCIRETSHLLVNMQYVHANNVARNQADVVLTLGSRIGETDWWGRPPNWALPSSQKMIQVDIDEEWLGRNKPTELPILGDIKVFLQKLIKALEPHKAAFPLETRKQKLENIRQEKAQRKAELNEALEDYDVPMHPAQVAHICRKVFDDDAVLVIDGGNTAIWANFYHEARTPNTVISTHKFGMLGAGVGQTLGAAAARPDTQVYCIIGDGAMGFHPQEIETAVRNDLKPIYLVLCDKQWGMVKMNQQFALRPLKTLVKGSLGPDETINADLKEIEFDKLALSMGAHGERISSTKELKPALERCLVAGKCAVIHIDVDHVKHMWAPNLIDFKKMHEEPKG